MFPPQPKLPICRNRPFQPLSGSQISDFTSDCGPGRMVALIRQKAGFLPFCSGCPATFIPEGSSLPVRTRLLVLTVSTEVMVVLGSASLAIWAQLRVAACAPPDVSSVAITRLATAAHERKARRRWLLLGVSPTDRFMGGLLLPARVVKQCPMPDRRAWVLQSGWSATRPAASAAGDNDRPQDSCLAEYGCR